jgi:predicted nucleotidyltransferase
MNAQPLLLSPAQRRLVREVVQAVLPGAQVQVFGSRATGRARPHSDLDLLLLTPRRLAWQDRAALRDRFEASELPFTVDVLALDDLAEGYRARVMDEARPL